MLITGAEVCVFVQDFARATAFYTGKLGLSLEFAYGEPPHYGLVSRDAARIALRLVKAPVFVGDIRAREELLAASLTLASAADIEVLFDAFSKVGVPMFQELRTQAWGSRTFIIQDPDGNLILFAAPVA